MRNIFPILGERLEYSRKIKGLSQKKIANVIGISTKTVLNYEKNDTLPDTGALIKWAQAVDCNPGWLLTGEGSMEAVGERKGNPARAVVESNEGHRKVVAEYEAFKKKIHDDLELVLERGEGQVTEDLVDNIDDCAQKIREKDRSWFFNKKKKAAGE